MDTRRMRNGPIIVGLVLVRMVTFLCLAVAVTNVNGFCHPHGIRHCHVHCSHISPSHKWLGRSRRMARTGSTEELQPEPQPQPKPSGDFLDVDARWKLQRDYGTFTFVSLFLSSLALSSSSSVSSVSSLASISLASGPLLTAGVSWILTSAVKKDRLSSDTYQRLNLCLAYTTALGALPLSFLGVDERTYFESVWGLVSVFGVISSLKGWFTAITSNTSNTANSAISRLTTGTKETLRGMTQFANWNGLAYLVSTLHVLYGNVTLLFQALAVWKESGLTPRFARQLYRYANLSMVGGCLYTLKDAADRNRLTGTTFIQLNLLVGLTLGMLTMNAYANGLAQAIVPGGISLFCVGNALVSTILKKRAQTQS